MFCQKSSNPLLAVGDLLGRDRGKLGQIAKTVAELEKLNAALALILEAEMMVECQAVALTAGRLVIAVKNASWATRLRYLLPEVLEKLREHSCGRGLAGVRVIIAEPLFQPPVRSDKKNELPGLPHRAKQLLQDMACGEPDQALAKVLREFGQS